MDKVVEMVEGLERIAHALDKMANGATNFKGKPLTMREMKASCRFWRDDARGILEKIDPVRHQR